MKSFIALALFFVTTTSATLVAQESGISVHLFTGYGVNYTNHGLVKFGGDLQYHFSNSLFAGIQASGGINGNRTIVKNVVWNGTYSLQFGRTNTISEKFSVQPYIGIGYQVLMQTNPTYADPATSYPELMSKVANKAFRTFNEDKANAQRYTMSRHTAVGIPVGVNFLIHQKSFGITLGTYLFLSKYSEAGLRFGLAFGQLR